MSGPVVAVVALCGLLAGIPVAGIVARIPEPSVVGRPARTAIAVVHAAAWAVVASTWTLWWQVVPFALLASALVVVSAIDVRVYRIPNVIVFSSLGLSLLLLAVASSRLPYADRGDAYRGALIGAAVYFAFLFIPHLIYPKGMGMGDVKLALVMGLYLGWGHSLVDILGIITAALFLGCVLGVICGLVVNVVRQRGGAFPFGPSLALGCFYILLQATGHP